MLLRGRFDYEPTGIMDSTHLRWFTAASLRALFERSGLEILDMKQTAGVMLPVYGRSILRRIPERLKSPAIRLGTRALPNLFGVQHVIKAKLAS